MTTPRRHRGTKVDPCEVHRSDLWLRRRYGQRQSQFRSRSPGREGPESDGQLVRREARRRDPAERRSRRARRRSTCPSPARWSSCAGSAPPNPRTQKPGLQWGVDHFGLRVKGDFDAFCAGLQRQGRRLQPRSRRLQSRHAHRLHQCPRRREHRVAGPERHGLKRARRKAKGGRLSCTRRTSN